jgi:predicted Rossmann fold flavoprotein
VKNDLTVVVGGGAAGILAAISKARRGEPVVICEKNARLGRKILATGNGRCNLLNDFLDASCYNQSARGLVREVFAHFGKDEILTFFREIGLHTYSQEGRIFPVTNQAASVLSVLELELHRLVVPVEYGFNCTAVSFQDEQITVSSGTGKHIACRKVILTGGGKTYPTFGADGSIYTIARNLGHTIVAPIPSAVPLVVKDPWCQILQGQRVTARARAIIDDQIMAEAAGEVLFTKYGLSGTCILDISGEVSEALNRRRLSPVTVTLDLVPFLEEAQLHDELRHRQQTGFPAGEMLAGLLPEKFNLALQPLLAAGDLAAVLRNLKARAFSVTGTRGWNEAEFTRGGVDVSEVAPETLSSKLHRSFYFAGEVLDVDGRRGGYNLAWAWASGYVAGLTA